MGIFSKIGHDLKIAGKDAAKVVLPVAEVGLPIVLPGPAGQEASELLAMLNEKLKGGSVMKNNGMGTWMIKLLSLIPYVVSGIEQIHADAKTGAEKKQLAMEALGLASAGAETIAPANDDPAIQAATQLASATIDGVKAVYNASVGKRAAPATPAPAPDPAPAGN